MLGCLATAPLAKTRADQLDFELRTGKLVSRGEVEVEGV
jgi:hypothetical protein